jgi:hypothetical protein
MRETCARVLAAALMTGAIAFVLAMPALFESARDAGRGLTAPPSSLRRSVQAPALTAPTRPAGVHSIRRPVTRPVVVRTTARAVRARRSRPHPPGADNTAPPSPRPEPETRELASTPPEPSAQPPVHISSPSAPTTAQAGPGKGKGKAKGHDKEKGGDKADTASSESGPVVAPTPPPPAMETQDDAVPPKEHGQGKGHAYGHGD